MKHDQLRAVAHNLADSLASGLGLPIGLHQTDIFGEARKSAEGFIEVDFLTGKSSGGVPSHKLSEAIRKYSEFLKEFCEKNGADRTDYKEFTDQFSQQGIEVIVTISIEDKNGKRSVDEYHGIPLKPIKTMDSLGRVRTIR